MQTPFETNPELDEMRDVVRDFCAEQAGEPVLRRIMESPSGFDAGLWRRLGEELGVLGLMAPEEVGGSGLGVVAQAAMMEEFGASLMTGPVFGTLALAIPALSMVHNPDIRSRYLPQLVSGEICAAFAVPDHCGGFDPDRVTVTADDTAEGWLLEGALEHVIDAPLADMFIVAARGPQGVGLWIVEKSAPGLTVEPMPVMDLTRRRGVLRLAGCQATKIADAAETKAVCDRTFRIGGALLASEQAGAAGRVLEFTVDYVRERVQFGRPIGSFQAIKHRCADLLVDVEHARSVARNAAWCVDQEDVEASRFVAVARSICSDAFNEVALAAIQLHGGIGFTWEHPAHLYLKRAVCDATLLGTAQEQRELIAARL